MPEHIRTSELSPLVDETLAATLLSIRIARQLAIGAARSVAAPDHRVEDIALVTTMLAC